MNTKFQDAAEKRAQTALCFSKTRQHIKSFPMNKLAITV